MKTTTILLVEDHQIVREGLWALLKSEPDFQLLGQAENGREAVTLVDELQPAIVVMDIAKVLWKNSTSTTPPASPATPSLWVSSRAAFK